LPETLLMLPLLLLLLRHTVVMSTGDPQCNNGRGGGRSRKELYS
jgi:hypothetical protein